MRQLVARLQEGDGRASDELLRRAGARLEALARRMLCRFPNVGRYEQTGDVLQGATLRLLRALTKIRPESTRAMFGLAAEQIRRELLDLSRRYYGPEGWGANHDSNALPAGFSSAPESPREPFAPDEDPAELERWTAFHEAVEHLPAEEREVFSLAYYHGWSQREIAELMQHDERTIRRKWRHACLRLNTLLEGNLPVGSEG
jgi:RNA polymerase sigma-70 factor (ECF subfamily)